MLKAFVVCFAIEGMLNTTVNVNPLNNSMKPLTPFTPPPTFQTNGNKMPPISLKKSVVNRLGSTPALVGLLPPPPLLFHQTSIKPHLTFTFSDEFSTNYHVINEKKQLINRSMGDFSLHRVLIERDRETDRQ